jgi:malate dehydrogenase (quinone)
MFKSIPKEKIHCDVLLVGAGIMSATLAVFLKELQPDLDIRVYERLDKIAAESSDAWNNAGTGHSALCELNYTPEKEDGTIDISKAIKILEQFEISKQFWSYLVNEGYFTSSNEFINAVPHSSIVFGEEDIAFLRKRFKALSACFLFSGMEYSEDKEELKKWFPLIMNAQEDSAKIAATKIDIGTDVNFGELTRSLFEFLTKKYEVDIELNHQVNDLKQDEHKNWIVEIENENTNEEIEVQAKFVFIGAGGGALRLLEKSEIEEGKGYAGFPVTGQWLICKNDNLIAQHHAKVYGKASVGAPPMSVPHLDTRIIDGKKELLFGPFAGFSTKFLKEGSYLDLPLSINVENLIPMIGAGLHNLSLTKYLIEQVAQSFEDKINDLRKFIPDAKEEDWEIAIAGQRVQVIKKDAEEGGSLEFGTEVIASKDGTIAALLGASPGASTSVSIMLELLQKCFPEKMKSFEWQLKLQEMIPTYGKHLIDDELLAIKTRAASHSVLGLDI